MGLSDYWGERRSNSLSSKAKAAGRNTLSESKRDSVTSSNKDEEDLTRPGSPGYGQTTSTGCTGASQCSSGYYCVNGTCLQGYSGAVGDGGSISGCGQDQVNSGDCGSTVGRPEDCSTSICGAKYGVSPRDNTCCNEETCCESDELGKVTCRCGACDPPNQYCDPFCAAKFVVFGSLSVNCTQENVCTRCEECRPGATPESNACEPLNPELANCWCDQSKSSPPEECLKCAANGDWIEDCENCEATYDVSVDCGCARATAKCVRPGCISGEGNQECIDLAWNTCYQACQDDPDPEPDPCTGNCYSQNFCDGPPPACPAGSSCTDNGTITAGGRTCYIRTVCDKTGVGSECEEPECNCNADCGDCELCSAQGVCEEDPDCTEDYRTTWKLTGEDYFVGTCSQDGNGNYTCNEGSVVLVPAVDKFVTTICAPLPHSLLRVDNNTVVPRPGGECKFGNDRKEWRIVDANGTQISDLIVSSGPSGTWCLGPDDFREPEYQSAASCS